MIGIGKRLRLRPRPSRKSSFHVSLFGSAPLCAICVAKTDSGMMDSEGNLAKMSFRVGPPQIAPRVFEWSLICLFLMNF